MTISMFVAVCLCHHEFIVLKIKLAYDGWVVYIYIVGMSGFASSLLKE